MSEQSHSSLTKLAVVLTGVLVLLVALLWVNRRQSRDAVQDAGTAVVTPTGPGLNPVSLDPAATEGRDANAGSDVTAQRTLSSRDVELAESTPGILVRVTDLDDHPVPGAEVRVLEDGPGFSTVTDDAGEGHLPLAPAPEDSVLMRIEAAGFHHAQGQWFRAEAIQVPLHRATRFLGRVVEVGTDLPVAGVQVRYLHGCRGCEPEETVAAADGSFTLPAVPIRRTFSLVLEAPGFPAQTSRVQFLDWSEEVRQVIELRRGVQLRGVVVDYVTRAPLPGVYVGVGPDSVLTDERGRFEVCLFGSRDGVTGVYVGKEGYCMVAWHGRPDPGTDLVIPMIETAGVTGCVMDQAGKPLAGVRVRVRPDAETMKARAARGEDPLSPQLRAVKEEFLGSGFDLERFDLSRAVRTDDEGRYEAAGLLPWSLDYEVKVYPERHQSAARRLPTLGPPGNRMRVDFNVADRPAGGTVTGSVTLNGQPNAAYVAWEGATRAAGQHADTGETFRFEDVEPGEVFLEAFLQGLELDQALVENSRVTLSVREGQEVRQDIALSIPMAPVAGRVVSGRGDSVPGVTVNVHCPEPLVSREGPTAENGTFTIDVPDIEPLYLVSVSSGPASVAEEDVRAGTVDLTLVLPDSATLRIRAIDRHTRLPVRDARFFWRPAGKGPFQDLRWISSATVTDPDGWIEHQIQAGPVDLMVRASASGYQPLVHENLLVPAGKPLRVEEDLERGHTVTLRLAAGAAPPLGRLQVLLLADFEYEDVNLSEDGSWIPGERLPREVTEERWVYWGDADEVVTLRGLAPGRYRFKVFPAEIEFEPPGLEVIDQDVEVEVRWRLR